MSKFRFEFFDFSRWNEIRRYFSFFVFLFCAILIDYLEPMTPA